MRMTRIVNTRIVNMVTGLVLSLCVSVAGAKTITDLAGRQVTIPDQVQRIAVVPIPWMAMIYTVDGSDKRIVGMHPSAKESYRNSILKTLAPDIETINSTFVNKDFTINGEELVSLRPDLVIVWDYQKEELQKLEKLGIPAVAIRYGDLTDVRDGITLLGEILGKAPRAAELLAFFDNQLAQLDSVRNNAASAKTAEQAAERPTVLYVRDKNLAVAGGTAVNDLMIGQAGGINVTHDMPVKANWPVVAMERIIAWNPDIIILSQFDNFTPSDIYENSVGWHGAQVISAVKNKRVYKAPIGIYRWDAPGIETPLMMGWMVARFAGKPLDDQGVQNNIRQFFKQFFNTDLTDAQMGEILSLEANRVSR